MTDVPVFVVSPIPATAEEPGEGEGAGEGGAAEQALNGALACDNLLSGLTHCLASRNLSKSNCLTCADLNCTSAAVSCDAGCSSACGGCC